MTTEQIEQELLKLPAAERARLAERLIASLDEDSDVEAAWIAEVRRRDEELQSGAVSAIPAEDALEAYGPAFRLPNPHRRFDDPTVGVGRRGSVGFRRGLVERRSASVEGGAFMTSERLHGHTGLRVSMCLLFVVAVGASCAGPDRTDESASPTTDEPFVGETMRAWEFGFGPDSGRPVVETPADSGAPIGEPVDAEPLPIPLSPDAEVLDGMGPDTAWFTPDGNLVWTRTNADERSQLYYVDDLYSVFVDGEFRFINQDSLIDLFWTLDGEYSGGQLLLGRTGEPEVALSLGGCVSPSLKDVSGDGLVDVVDYTGGGLLDEVCNDLMHSACFDDYDLWAWPTFYLQANDSFKLDTIVMSASYAPYGDRYRSSRDRMEAAWTANAGSFLDWCDVPEMLSILDRLAERADRLSAAAIRR